MPGEAVLRRLGVARRGAAVAERIVAIARHHRAAVVGHHRNRTQVVAVEVFGIVHPVAASGIHPDRLAACIDVLLVFRHPVGADDLLVVRPGIQARVEIDGRAAGAGFLDAGVVRIVDEVQRGAIAGDLARHVPRVIADGASGTAQQVAVGVIGIGGVERTRNLSDGMGSRAVGINARIGFAGDVADAVVLVASGAAGQAGGGKPVQCVVAKHLILVLHGIGNSGLSG